MGHVDVVTQNVMEEKYFARDIKNFHHGDTEARRNQKLGATDQRRETQIRKRQRLTRDEHGFNGLTLGCLKNLLGL
jgi:hypothetical protein